jgi:hypothetical protein
MWRSRADGRPADSIKQFHRHLRVLNGTEPHGYSRALTAQVGSAVITAPMTYRRSAVRSSTELRRRRTIERRRNVLFCLAGFAGVTLFFALLGMPMMLGLNVLADASLAGYVALLVHLRSAAAERDMKLRFLPNQGGNSFSDEVAAWSDLNAGYAAVAAH